ncbi:polyketide synthase dehydratase domain-containing protein, partial [Nocardiopsis listeri]|uniref:polyketide synthase dehydratase domain-containing protein n=1 Tax=Nocardiopsis listeri TaxID=53440 RepID=UPI00167FF08D
PVVIGDEGIRVQVLVSPPDDSGRRAFTVHFEVGDTWTRHASGVLGDDVSVPGAGELTVWPPEGAAVLPTDGLYERLSASGYGYGEAFRGLRAAWRRGDEVFAEVALPDGVEPQGFGIHPALLDAALHVNAADADGQGQMLPFVWSGVSLHAVGATTLRVRVTSAEPEGVSLEIADTQGAPVATVGALVSRPVDAQALTSPKADTDSLYRVEWAPISTSEAPATHAWIDELASLVDTEVPHVLMSPSGTAPATVTNDVLATLQTWLADNRGDSSVLVLVTRGAVATEAGETVTDLAGAAARGLVRSAQVEHPGRFMLLDLDGSETEDLVAGALATGEPELAVRGGQVSAPRLARPADALVLPDEPWRLEVTASGTVDGINPVPNPQAAVSLGVGEVRVGVRAAGVNFRDVLISLGMYPGQALVG